MRYNLLSFGGVAQIVLDVATGSPLNLGPVSFWRIPIIF